MNAVIRPQIEEGEHTPPRAVWLLTFNAETESCHTDLPIQLSPKPSECWEVPTQHEDTCLRLKCLARAPAFSAMSGSLPVTPAVSLAGACMLAPPACTCLDGPVARLLLDLDKETRADHVVYSPFLGTGLRLIGLARLPAFSATSWNLPVIQPTSQAVACLPPPTTGVCSDSLVAFSPLGMVMGTRADHAVDSPILETSLRLIGLTYGESATPTAIILLRACCDKCMCSLVPPWAFREVEAFVAPMYPCGTKVTLSLIQPALDGYANRKVEDNACVDWRSALSVASLASRSCLTWPDCCFSYVHQCGWIVQLPLILAESWYAFSFWVRQAVQSQAPIVASMQQWEAKRRTGVAVRYNLQYLAFAAGATTSGGKSISRTLPRWQATCESADLYVSADIVLLARGHSELT